MLHRSTEFEHNSNLWLFIMQVARGDRWVISKEMEIPLETHVHTHTTSSTYR